MIPQRRLYITKVVKLDITDGSPIGIFFIWIIEPTQIGEYNRMLTNIIIDKVKSENGISFRDFMEMALYYPDLGYYTSSSARVGMDGDYYTSCNFSLFGILIGKQIEEMWYNIGRGEFTIVEYGAGTGVLCRNILNYLKINTELYRQLRYCMIEKSPVMRKAAQTHLMEKVYWVDSIAELGGVTGCILSNELLDNLAVHKVIMQDILMEVFVDYDNGFREFLKPAPYELNDYFRQLGVRLPYGFCAEVNLEAIRWIHDISAALAKGYIMTIDYGYPSEDLYKICRKDGTLLCYNGHCINDRPFEHVGEQDITSHVNFSALHRWGLKSGLEHSGFINQKDFLISLGFNHYFAGIIQAYNKNNYEKIKSLDYFINSMSPKFKIMIQHKGCHNSRLTGLRSGVLHDGITNCATTICLC